MGFLIALVVVIVIGVCYAVFVAADKRATSQRSSRSATQTTTQTRRRITVSDVNRWASDDDLKYELSQAQARLAKQIRTNSALLQRAAKAAEVRVSQETIDAYARMGEASENLERNIAHELREHHGARKFERYCSLHYRSAQAAACMYDEVGQIQQAINGIDRLIRSGGRGNRGSGGGRNGAGVANVSVRDLRAAKAIYVELRRTLLERKNELFVQTAQLRDKIRDECGERGRQWYARLQQRTEAHKRGER